MIVSVHSPGAAAGPLCFAALLRWHRRTPSPKVLVSDFRSLVASKVIFDMIFVIMWMSTFIFVDFCAFFHNCSVTKFHFVSHDSENCDKHDFMPF